MRMEAQMENTAKKLPANLSIRSDLLREAKERKINLSQTLEERLEEILREQNRQAWREEEILREQNRQAWREENREAIKAANDFVARHGLWSDGLRRF
jgi:antitoxin CcdA